GVYARIGSPARDAFGPLAGNPPQGGLQLILNRALTWLPLPTGEIGAVIRQSQPECRHLDTRGCNFPQMRWYIRASPIERATCLVFLILRPLPPASAPWLILCA